MVVTMNLYTWLFSDLPDDRRELVKSGLKGLVGIIAVLLIILALAMFLNTCFRARVEAQEIAVHNERQFAQYQRYHGKHNTRAVIYEADKSYFYDQKGEKVYLP
jgi:hypothetical protein